MVAELIHYGARIDCVPAIARRAEELATRQRVLVVCANDISAERLSEALACRDGITVFTAAELALSVFEDPRVQKASKRGPRLLDRNEVDVLLEDLKVSGLKPRRLREMLKFLLKGLADGAASEEGWLVNRDEQTLFALLEENLEMRHALLPVEASYRALQGIDAVPAALDRTAVVVEDFGALSKTSQRLVRTASNGDMVVFASGSKGASASEPYPYRSGIAQWAKESGAVVSALPAEVDPIARHSVSLPTPNAEFAYIAEAVASLLEGAEAPGGLLRSIDILVAVPNGVWMREICHALAARGIPVIRAAGAPKAKGDPRKPESCGAVEEAAFAKLVLDPSDMTALRTYAGCGDWLMCSDSFLELMAWARDHGMTVEEALRMLHADKAAASEMKAFGKVDAKLTELEGRLREAACPHDAAGVGKPRPQGVTVALYEQCHGRHAKHVLFAGAVNGFIPKRDAVGDGETVDHRKRALVRDRALFDDVCSVAEASLTITTFETDRIENTQVLPMEVERIYVKDGVRRARTVPCQFIA